MPTQRFSWKGRDKAVAESMALQATSVRSTVARKANGGPSSGQARAASHHAVLSSIAAADGAEDATVLGADGAPLFVPGIPRPKPGDWLAENDERGQSYVKYAKQTGFSVAQPHGTFDTIVIVTLQPAGVGDAVPCLPAELLQELKAYIEAFYYPLKVAIISVPVRLAHEAAPRSKAAAAAVEVPTVGGPTGIMGTPQVPVRMLLEHAIAAKNNHKELRRKAVMTMGLTMLDLTLDNGSNAWVYGAAVPMETAGVFSFARFRPSFAGEDPAAADSAETMRRRAFKVLSHELGHLFGLRHCTDFLCLMNGTNHIHELNRQPLLECPACTLKLSYTLPGWSDLAGRYRRLGEELRRHGMAREADMVQLRILPSFAPSGDQPRQQPVAAPRLVAAAAARDGAAAAVGNVAHATAA